MRPNILFVSALTHRQYVEIMSPHVPMIAPPACMTEILQACASAIGSPKLGQRKDGCHA